MTNASNLGMLWGWWAGLSWQFAWNRVVQISHCNEQQYIERTDDEAFEIYFLVCCAASCHRTRWLVHWSGDVTVDRAGAWAAAGSSPLSPDKPRRRARPTATAVAGRLGGLGCAAAVVTGPVKYGVTEWPLTTRLRREEAWTDVCVYGYSAGGGPVVVKGKYALVFSLLEFFFWGGCSLLKTSHTLVLEVLVQGAWMCSYCLILSTFSLNNQKLN